MKKILTTLRKRNLVPILLLYFSVGIAGLILPFSRGLFQRLVPLTILMSAGLLLLYNHAFGRRFWITSAALVAAALVVEAIGVATGVPFGEYTYGETLGPGLFNTPLMIGLNWWMLVYCSLSMVSRYIDIPYFRAIGAAVIMVVYDIALEPAAIRFDMWRWNGGIVPLQNYLAWFGVAFALGFLGNHFRVQDKENKMAQPLFLIQLGFFIILDLWIIAEKIWDLS